MEKRVCVQNGTVVVRRPLARAIAMSVMAAAMLGYGAAAVAQDPLGSARDLYAAAAFDDALARLNQLRASAHAPDDDRVIEQYRALCLFALGRSSEAESAIESMVAAAPAYRPSEGDASPRVLAAFREVRRRLLPGIIQQKYADAKAAFDRTDFVAAKAGFAQVIDLLADPLIESSPMQQQLSGLLTLANGFRDLSTTANAPPPAVVPPPAAAVPAPAPAPTPQPPRGRIYASEDPAVIPPVVVRQSFAALSGVFALRTGVVEIVIDETGAVEQAAIRVAVNPVYDRLALATAKSWRYRPATFGGVPVKFRKLVRLDLEATR
jgi:tetratricopeptide (TPR) repeat protein